MDVLTFEKFHEEVHERPPLPWQSRLAELVAERGWPGQIAVPTGLGKTTCIDIAIWALAHNGTGASRLQTRLWYVVNRRLLVDAAEERANKLRDLLAAAVAGKGGPAITSVAEKLLRLSLLGAIPIGSGDKSPLHVVKLRGGADLGVRAPDPSQPAVILATVPMFASRWLFRGYGSSYSTRPIDAAHAGCDSLILLDEAHLARPLLDLQRKVELCDTGDPTATGLSPERARPRFVAMTATGDGAEDAFMLDEADRSHPLVAKRLGAQKKLELIETTASALSEELATRASAVAVETSGSCVVFVNTPRTARTVFSRLSKPAKGVARMDVRLLTGRMREREAERSKKAILESAGGERPAEAHEEPLVVVATQTLEVGADVDFCHLVTESAGVRAIVQRLGRLNRFGDHPGATCTIVHASDAKSHDIYGEETAAVWRLLQQLSSSATEVDLCPRNVHLLGTPQDAPARVGELLQSHLWEWAKTTAPASGEAPPELFFDGVEVDAELSVVWRSYRPDPGERIFPDVGEAEAVQVPVGELRATLIEQQVARLDSSRVSVELVDPSDLRPGDVVVLNASVGHYDEHGWAPEATDPVLDISPLRSGALVIDEGVFENLAPGSMARIREASSDLVRWVKRQMPKDHSKDDGTACDQTSDDDYVEDEDAEMLKELVGVLKACAPHSWLTQAEWSTFLDNLDSRVNRPVGPKAFQRCWIGPRGPRRARRGLALASDALDELSMTPESRTLAEHLEKVGSLASCIGERLGLTEEVVLALRTAGQWHDLGKHDPRFQRWLSPDRPPDEAMAKSAQRQENWQSSRAASGWPAGGRHEALSVRLAGAWLSGRELACDVDTVLHLVATHHGNGRPLVPSVEDPEPADVIADVDGRFVRVSGNLSETDWDQPRRFRTVCERYGLWGVALLECALRQADWVISQLTEVS